MRGILDLKDQSQSQSQSYPGAVGPRVTPQSHGSKLVSADFHGAMLEVVRSRCPGRVGIKGIVVRDTKFTFVLVTVDNEVKSEYSVVFIFLYLFSS